MFQPSRTEVRQFFCEAWRKHGANEAMTDLERRAVACVLEHPEYHALLADARGAAGMDFPVEAGRENPFLHLSMHLGIEEQVAIDQPPGVRALVDVLAARHGDHHAGVHEVMECLGETLWRTQRGTLPADMASINDFYLDCLKRRATST